MFSSTLRIYCCKPLGTSLRKTSFTMLRYASSNAAETRSKKTFIKFRKHKPEEKTNRGVEDPNKVVAKYGETPFKFADPYSAEVANLFVAAKSRRMRYQKKLIMLEGRRLIEDALIAGVTPVRIFFTRRKLIEDLPILDKYLAGNRTVLRKIPYQNVQDWSDLTTSPGLTGIFEMPNLETHVCKVPTLPITIICDNVREPGNLGAVLRIAAALPVEKVFLPTGCCDLWDPKVIRSSCGAMFNLNITNICSWEDINDQCSGNVIIADNLSSYATQKEDSILDVEDYNVIRAEDIRSDIDVPPDSEDEDEDSGNDSDIESSDPEDWRKMAELAVMPYYDVNYTGRNKFIIIVGGETEGLSLESFMFAKDRKGVRVNIPQSQCVNSLNVATALGIIAFEVKRQLALEKGHY